jgi:toxin ParE1/3/4
MPTNARLAKLADIEFSEAIAYYEAAANMGLAFAREVQRVTELAKQFPDSGLLVQQSRTGRQARLFRLSPEFPYDLVTTVIDEEDLLLVVAVAHHSRKPKYWVSRLARAPR